MGGGSKQYSSTRSNSGTYESELSQEQLKILRNREKQYNSYFFPEFQKAMSELDVNSDASKAKLAQQTAEINTAYGDTQKQTMQNLAQQNLLGDQSGVQAALTAKNNRAKASSLANAYYNTLTDNQGQKTNLLQIGAALMPSTTQSTAYHQTSTTRSRSSGSQGNIL